MEAAFSKLQAPKTFQEADRLMSDMLLLNSRLKQVTGRVRSDGHMKVMLFQKLEAPLFRFAVSKINDLHECSFAEAMAMVHRKSGVADLFTKPTSSTSVAQVVEPMELFDGLISAMDDTTQRYCFNWVTWSKIVD